MAIGDLTAYTLKLGSLDLLNTYGVSVMELNIYEDIESPTGPFGDIRFIDGANALGSNKINGSEAVSISFTSNDFNTTASFNMSCMHGIDWKPGSHQGADGFGGGSLFHKDYLIKICSPEFIYCQGNYINKDYDELCSTIVQDIVTTYFRGGSCQTPDPTHPKRRIIAQFEHPLKFLNRVIDESISSGHESSLYQLYKTRSGGSEQFIYETFENAFNRKTGITLKLSNILKGQQATYDDKIHALYWVEGEMFYRPSRAQNKSFTVTYNMSTGNVVNYGQGEDIGKIFKVLGNYIYDTAPQQTTGVPVFMYISAENQEADYPLAEAKRKRLAFQSHLVQDAIYWECVGNPGITVGSVVTLKIPQMVEGQESTDQQLSEDWCVVSITHKIRSNNITPRYVMVCKGVKCAYATQSTGSG